jgi:hypothetical protein
MNTDIRTRESYMIRGEDLGDISIKQARVE